MEISEDRIVELTIGYDLDCGGYAFENPTIDALREVGCVILDLNGHAADYVPWVHDAVYLRGASCAFYAFKPSSISTWDEWWPNVLPGPWDDGSEYNLVGMGRVNESERECYCHGRLTADGWEATGDVRDTPWPECHRCEGTGFITSEAGYWAVYALSESTDETDNDRVGGADCEGPEQRRGTKVVSKIHQLNPEPFTEDQRRWIIGVVNLALIPRSLITAEMIEGSVKRVRVEASRWWSTGKVGKEASDEHDY